MRGLVEVHHRRTAVELAVTVDVGRATIEDIFIDPCVSELRVRQLARQCVIFLKRRHREMFGWRAFPTVCDRCNSASILVASTPWRKNICNGARVTRDVLLAPVLNHQLCL